MSGDVGYPVAVVTGGNRGIGFEICRALGERGWWVVLTARDATAGWEAASGLKEECGGLVHFHPLDVTGEESIRTLAEHVRGELGRLDALVNNAAVYLDEGVPALEVEPEVVRRTMETNLYGPLRLCQVLAPLMRPGGCIVNVSSGYGTYREMDDPETFAYKASKLGLNAMTRTLAAELRPRGVRVNAVDPGWVRTRMGGADAPRDPRQAADTAVWLATLPEDGPTGGFFRDRRAVEW